jgi:hypothetical protein
MRRSLLIAALTVLTGCTNATIEASKARQVGVAADTIALKLVSASILGPTSSAPETEPQDRLYLCIARTRLPDGPEESFLVRVPQPYPFVDERRAHYPFHEVGPSLVLAVGTNADIASGCATPKGMSLVDGLPIIEAVPDEHVDLPAGRKDAIIYTQRNEHGLSLAYISAAPIFGGYHSVAIDLTRSVLYTEYRGARPYLLLLTPITAAGDIVLTVALAFTVATRAVICPSSIASCD